MINSIIIIYFSKILPYLIIININFFFYLVNKMVRFDVNKPKKGKRNLDILIYIQFLLLLYLDESV